MENAANLQGPRAETLGEATKAAEILARRRLKDSFFLGTGVGDLKQKSVRAGAVALIAQGLKFGLQTGSVMILARLLAPEDFGLQGMVVAVSGLLSLFKDAGLSMATVQREIVTHEQTSTLFWINLA